MTDKTEMKYVVKFRLIEGDVSTKETTLDLGENEDFEFSEAALGLHPLGGHKVFFILNVKNMSTRIRIGPDAFSLLVTDKSGEEFVIHRIKASLGRWFNKIKGEEFVIQPGDRVTVVERIIEFVMAPVRSHDASSVQSVVDQYSAERKALGQEPKPVKRRYLTKNARPLLNILQEYESKAKVFDRPQTGTKIVKLADKPVKLEDVFKLKATHSFKVVVPEGQKVSPPPIFSALPPKSSLKNGKLPSMQDQLKVRTAGFIAPKKSPQPPTLQKINYGTRDLNPNLEKLESTEEWKEVADEAADEAAEIDKKARRKKFVTAGIVGLSLCLIQFLANQFESAAPTPARTPATNASPKPSPTPKTAKSTPTPAPTPPPPTASPEPVRSTPAPTPLPTPGPTPTPSLPPQVKYQSLHDAIRLGSMTSPTKSPAEKVTNEEPYKTSFFTAIRDGDLKTVKSLIKSHKVDSSIKTPVGATPYMLACYSGQTAIMKYLARGQINLDERDSRGATALMYAVSSNQTETAKLLLKAGADPHLKMSDGSRALELAMKKRNTLLVRLLKDAMAKRRPAELLDPDDISDP